MLVKFDSQNFRMKPSPSIAVEREFGRLEARQRQQHDRRRIEHAPAPARLCVRTGQQQQANQPEADEQHQVAAKYVNVEQRAAPPEIERGKPAAAPHDFEQRHAQQRDDARDRKPASKRQATTSEQAQHEQRDDSESQHRDRLQRAAPRRDARISSSTSAVEANFQVRLKSRPTPRARIRLHHATGRERREQATAEAEPGEAPGGRGWRGSALGKVHRSVKPEKGAASWVPRRLRTACQLS